jgi:hypothetical protein
LHRAGDRSDWGGGGAIYRAKVMDESKWFAEREPQRMIRAIESFGRVRRTKRGRRQKRLVVCGCCRLIWEHFRDSRLTDAVEIAERFADGLASKEELRLAGGTFRPMSFSEYDPEEPGVHRLTAASMAFATTQDSPLAMAFWITDYPFPLAGYRGTREEANALICSVFRDIFGNPFRPLAFDPAWRTSTAVALARQIYESRDFSPMPILADALQDAGCDNDDVLNHCRDTGGVHVRGCWVVDRVLGKE